MTIQTVGVIGAGRMGQPIIGHMGRGADEGKLLSFVGGDARTFERLKPVLACFCSDIVHAGGVGTAQAAKAANNLAGRGHRIAAGGSRSGHLPDVEAEEIPVGS